MEWTYAYEGEGESQCCDGMEGLRHSHVGTNAEAFASSEIRKLR